MQQDVSKKRAWMPSPAMIIAIVALIVALGGTALAAGLGKNSVGTKQLKSKAVTGPKIANNAVNGTKVANNSLSGSDINLAALGTVPNASASTEAGNANTVAGHAASCPGGTVLIRGVCFDSAASSQLIEGVEAASDFCTGKGGYLPGPLELSSTAGVLSLGNNAEDPAQREFTDTYYGNTAGGSYTTILVSQTELQEGAYSAAKARVICAYPLVR
jgi:hypothetical protein